MSAPGEQEDGAEQLVHTFSLHTQRILKAFGNQSPADAMQPCSSQVARA